MSVYLRKKDGNFSQNQLGVFNQFINKNESKILIDMVFIAWKRVLPPRELNPSTSLLSEKLVRPLRQSPPNMHAFFKIL